MAFFLKSLNRKVLKLLTSKPILGKFLERNKSLIKTVLVRSDGRIVIPKKIADTIGIIEGTAVTFEDLKNKFSKKVIVQPSGRVVIPLEIRETLDINEGMPLFFIVHPGGNILTIKTPSGELFHIIVPS